MRLIKRIESVKELLLGTLFARDELDIIEDQYVYVPELSFKFIHFIAPERRDQFVHEGF